LNRVRLAVLSERLVFGAQISLSGLSKSAVQAPSHLAGEQDRESISDVSSSRLNGMNNTPLCMDTHR